MFDDQAHHARHHHAQDAGEPERLAVVDDQRVGDGRAEHEDCAVGEVQDVEDAEYERVADCEQSVDGADEDRVEDLLVHRFVRLLRSGRSAALLSVAQLALIWWTRVKPPTPSIAITQTVCLTSCVLVNWNGPRGVWMLTDSMAVRSLSRSPARSVKVRLARLAASARTLIAA